MQCPRCQRENRPSARFCDECATPVVGDPTTDEIHALQRLLADAREQHAATSEILRVISTSQTDTQPVFDALVQRAVRLCEAMQGTVSRLDGTLIQVVAHCGMTPEEFEQSTRTFPRPLSDPGGTATAIRTGSVCLIADLDAQEELTSGAARDMLRARRLPKSSSRDSASTRWSLTAYAALSSM